MSQYYLSGALASKASASVMQVFNGFIDGHTDDFIQAGEFISLDFSPSGEYLLAPSMFGTGAYNAASYHTSFSPEIIIYQSGGSGYQVAAAPKIKSSTALNSSNNRIESYHFGSSQFLDDRTIVHFAAALDLQDGQGTITNGEGGAFIVITGSGANWGYHKIITGSSAMTASSQGAHVNYPNRIAPATGYNGLNYRISFNNKYSSTATTRVALHGEHMNSSTDEDKDSTITMFQSASGTGWSFHSQIQTSDDFNSQAGVNFSAHSIQSVTWIDENSIYVTVAQYDDHFYAMLLTYDGSDWSVVPNTQLKVTSMNQTSKFHNGHFGFRWTEYDEVNKRLYLGEGAEDIYIFNSASGWTGGGTGSPLYNGVGDEMGGLPQNHDEHFNMGFNAMNNQANAFKGPRSTRFAFGTDRASIITMQTVGDNGSTYGTDAAYFLILESGSSGWTSTVNNTSQMGLRTEHIQGYDSASPSLGSYTRSSTDMVNTHNLYILGGQGANQFAWNSLNGGDGNRFAFRAADGGSNNLGRVGVIDFNAFPAANPSLDATVTETVGASGGTVKAGGTANSPKITVTVGSGDLDGNTSLTAAVVSDESTKAQNLTAIKKEAGSAGAHFVGDIVRLTPHGTEFNSAVQVQFELDSAPADLTIWKRDSHDGDYTQWYQLPSTYWSVSGTTVTINTTRFSEYAGLGGINVARTKLSNTQLAQLTTTDLVASTSIQISGSSNSFKDRTVAADDLFLIEDKSNGTTYHVSASQMAEFFGGLVTVTSSGHNTDFRLTMVSPTDNADIGLEADAGLKYNPSTDMLKGVNLSGSGDLTMAGSATIDDNLILTKGFVQIKASELNVTGGIKASSVISGSSHLQVAGNTDLAGTLDVVGLISGSGGLDIGGQADFGAAVNVEGLLSGSGGLDIGGAADFGSTVKAQGTISGSSDLTIAGSATIDDNVVLTKGYLQVADDNAFISGSTMIKLPASGQFVVRDSSGAAEFAVDENGDLTAGTLTFDTSGNTLAINSTIQLNGGTGMVSGSNVVSAGNVTADDNIIATKGYVQVKAGNVHVTGNVLAQQIKGTAISGSGNLTIAGDATIAGDFTVNGDLTYINTTNLAVEDSLILLGSGSSGSPVNDQGIILERGASANAAVVYDESSDRFAFAYVGTASAGSTGNLDVALGAPVSASAFFGDGSGLTGVGAQTIASNNDNNELALTFVSGAGIAAAKLFTDASVLKYNTSTNTLKSVALSASSTITAVGIISGSSHLQIAGDTDLAGTLDVVGLISGSGGLDIGGAADFGSTVKAQGNISGSSDLTIAGSATVDDNVILTKGYLQVKADNMHITGAVLASGQIKGSNLSGSGDLTIAGSATIDDNLILTKGYVQIKASELNVTGGIKASSVISGSSHLQVAGNTDLAGTLDVVGLISGSGGIDIGGQADFGAAVNVEGLLSGSGGMDMAGTADFGGAVYVQGLLSGSGGLDIGGVADFGAAVNIQGALDVDGNTTVDVFTASDTATFGGAVNLGDSGADAIVVSGALDVGSQNTKFRSNQIEMLNLDSLTLDSNDSTHFLLVQDSSDNFVKKESVTDLVQHITGAAGTRGGLQVHQGKLFIVQKEESFMSSSLTGHAHTASLDGAVLSGSLMVFLNGLLQTRSGSANLGAGSNSIFDYRLDSYTAPTKVLMADALDSDDVLIVRYIQK